MADPDKDTGRSYSTETVVNEDYAEPDTGRGASTETIEVEVEPEQPVQIQEEKKGWFARRTERKEEERIMKEEAKKHEQEVYKEKRQEYLNKKAEDKAMAKATKPGALEATGNWFGRLGKNMGQGIVGKGSFTASMVGTKPSSTFGYTKTFKKGKGKKAKYVQESGAKSMNLNDIYSMNSNGNKPYQMPKIDLYGDNKRTNNLGVPNIFGSNKSSKSPSMPNLFGGSSSYKQPKMPNIMGYNKKGKGGIPKLF